MSREKSGTHRCGACRPGGFLVSRRRRKVDLDVRLDDANRSRRLAFEDVELVRFGMEEEIDAVAFRQAGVATQGALKPVERW